MKRPRPEEAEAGCGGGARPPTAPQPPCNSCVRCAEAGPEAPVSVSSRECLSFCFSTWHAARRVGADAPFTPLPPAAGDPSGECSSTFHPLFTHQSFGDAEAIEGIADLTVLVTLSNPGLAALVTTSYASVDSEDRLTSLYDKLALGLPHDWTREPAEFRRLSHSLSHAVPAGARLAAYSTPDGAKFEVRMWKLDTEGARAYHRRLECLAWWLIDGACALWHCVAVCAPVTALPRVCRPQPRQQST